MNFIKRIDDLGRIVIPKDIRKELEIETNENMEISINNNEIILKKYDRLNNKNKLIVKLGKVIYNLLNKNMIITNREYIIYSNNDSLINKKISNELKNYIVNRIELEGNKKIELIDEYTINSNLISKNLILDSDACGILIIYDDNINEKDKLILDIFYRFISSI